MTPLSGAARQVAAWLEELGVGSWQVRVEHRRCWSLEVDRSGEGRGAGDDLWVSCVVRRGGQCAMLRCAGFEVEAVGDRLSALAAALGMQVPPPRLVALANLGANDLPSLRPWQDLLKTALSIDIDRIIAVALRSQHRLLAVEDSSAGQMEKAFETRDFTVDCTQVGQAACITRHLCVPLADPPRRNDLELHVRRCLEHARIASAPRCRRGSGRVAFSSTAVAQILAYLVPLSLAEEPATALTPSLRKTLSEVLGNGQQWWREPGERPDTVRLSPGEAGAPVAALHLAHLDRVSGRGAFLDLEGSGWLEGAMCSGCGLTVPTAVIVGALADPCCRGTELFGLRLDSVDYWSPALDIGEHTWRHR